MDKGFVYLKKLWDDEELIVSNLRRIASTKAGRPFPKCFAEWLSKSQQDAANMALGNQISIICGGPGTGKTVTSIEILKTAVDAGFDVKVMAPTGKAASRIAEAISLGEYKSLEKVLPTTIHRGLEWFMKDDTDTEGFPRRDSKTPIQADMILVDELSMVPTSLMADFLQAVDSGTKLVFVGDPNQLPPVGPGQPFIDIIESGAVPVYELQDVWRQAKGSKIWLACEAIRDQSPYKFYQYATKDGDEIAFNALKDSAEIKHFFGKALTKFAASDSDPYNNLQILTPVREKGDASAVSLNTLCARIFNPSKDAGIQLGNSGLGRPGDKIIQTKNNYKRFVFNGDQGRIKLRDRLGLQIETRRRKQKLITWSRWPQDDDDRQPIKMNALGVDIAGRYLPYTEGEALNELMLSYALTVHRFQGSQSPHVAIACPVEAWSMMGRRLLLTAVSRARKRVVLAGPVEVITKAITTDRDSSRRTGLKEKLQKC